MLKELQDFTAALRASYGRTDLDLTVEVPSAIFQRFKQEVFLSEIGDGGNIKPKSVILYTACGKAKVVDHGDR
jgi:hypothetical protein